ncbi:MAG: HAD-IIIC family phosphatase [Proteobacteria bacterium]|nr:HAD-IIIC family phosphatase [Pseudomonadota bacterium]
MKETVPGDRETTRLPLPPEVARGFDELAEAAIARSELRWGEHCSECSFPSCYASCAFYTPRGDGHCRRFERGMEPLAGRPGLHRVRFRKWGKLEARGPAPVRPLGEVRQAEVTDRRAAALLNLPLPHRVSRNLTWRWNERRTAAAHAPGPVGDAFVVEAWAADGGTHPFTVSFLEDGGTRMHQTSFTAGPGYSRLVASAAEIGAHVDLSGPLLIQIEPVGEAEGRDVVFGRAEFMSFAGASPASVGPDAPAPAPSPVRATPASLAKVVVWDLDETLWTGTLVEDGAAGVRLRPEAVEAVHALDARGVLQSVASKNDAAEALAALGRFGLTDFFLHPQIGWGPKSAAVAEIARALDLGLDSFVFIDDQPFERGEVAAAHPAVRLLPHTAVAGLLEQPFLDLPITAESGRRRALYQAEAARRTAAAALRTESGGDEAYLQFLRSSGIELRVAPLTAADVERVYELSQRTNQLNFTGAKYAREEAAALSRPRAGLACLTLRCADRFGDYGLIGFTVLDLQAGVIDAFFMSCRVQRKRVEQAAFDYVLRTFADHGHSQARARFVETERNAAAGRMLAELGFAREPEGLWLRATTAAVADADVVRLVLEPRPAAQDLQEAAA